MVKDKILCQQESLETLLWIPKEKLGSSFGAAAPFAAIIGAGCTIFDKLSEEVGYEPV